MGLSFQNRFGCTNNVLDRPERLVDMSYGLGIIDSVSPQHPDTIVALFGFDFFFIDDKVTASFDFEIAAVALVADQAFVTVAQLLLSVCNNRLPIVRILTALFFIETDYIATLFYPNFLDFERCWILGFAALRNTLKPACSAAEHRQT